jgi:hypothetical protein
MPETHSITAQVHVCNSTDIPEWRPDRRYSRGVTVQRNGAVYTATADTWLMPGASDLRDWTPEYVAMPWRPSLRYDHGAMLYSTASGAVWIYEEPAEEWCLFAVLSKQDCDEIRTSLRSTRMNAE